MKALDISPRYIGFRLRITDEHNGLHVEGTLSNLYVETVEDTPVYCTTPHVHPAAVIIELGDNVHRLTGAEEVAIIGGRQ